MNDATFEDISRTVVNPPDGSADGNISSPPPGQPKSQGIVYAHGNCDVYNTCSGSVKKRLVRTYTKQPGDVNYTATITGYVYAYVALAAGNTARGDARFSEDDNTDPDQIVWGHSVSMTTAGSDSKTVQFDKTLDITVTLKTPVYAYGQGTRGIPPVGTAYGYGNATVTYPNP